ncbi:RWD domain-containing protein [Podospora conica]|nr:RWD domain-containing protein [Schizothecium conicum]
MADIDTLETPRDIELSTLKAIYPEIQQVRTDDPYTISLDIPVAPTSPVVVFFPAVDAAPVATPQNGNHVGNGTNGLHVDSHEVAHLPSLHLEISFGPEYPTNKPPRVTISANPPWLPRETLTKLEDDAPRLWEEMGRDMIGFTYIDHIQQSGDTVFGLVDDNGALEVDPQHKIAILDHDIKAKHAAFERQTFECGVCLDPKKGAVCHKMNDCGHVFCVPCLQDFYNAAIQQGDLAAVRCPAFGCAKEREKLGNSKRKKPRTYINPSELLQIPLDVDVVRRYVSLKYKTELESDKNTIYCPRQWCNGAARSKKHKKPEGFELVEVSDDEGSDNDAETKPYKPVEDLLAICEDCHFAFCTRCFQSWHGEFVRCVPLSQKGEPTAEELASLNYINYHSTACPTCASRAQKTHGCNHMICYRCQTHFCYLCAAWLEPGNPYQHFNELPNGKATACYMRLWELEEGDNGSDVDENDARPPMPNAGPVVGHPEPEIEEPADDIVDHEINAMLQAVAEANPGNGAPQPNAPEPLGADVGIAREGPLVLRIAANNPPAGAGRGGPRGRPAVAAPIGGVRGGAAGARGRGGRGGQRGRGAGRGRQNNQGDQAARGGQQQGQQRRIIRRGGGDGALEAEDGELDAEQQAWVRQFVRDALNDEEDDDDHNLVLLD